MSTIAGRPTPGPIPPADGELEAWNALSREERIASYRAYLAQPDCDRIASMTMADILTEARARVAARRRG